MIVTSEKEFKILREGGKKLATVLSEIEKSVLPGITTLTLDQLAERAIRSAGGAPSFKGYRTRGASRPYPATLCVSINDEVVHGIPSERVLRVGDIVGLDIGMEYKGLFTDMAITVPVGALRDPLATRLIKVTKRALEVGIENARVGGHVGDIGAAIQKYAESEGFGVIRELVGHGVGRSVHEEPEIPNWGRKGIGPEFTEGMVIAIEPMLTQGSPRVRVADDGWTWKTIDSKPAAHFEHTIIITKNGPEIVTK